MLQTVHKSKIWQRRNNQLTWCHDVVFWRCFVSLVKFSYWSKFYVKIINDSGVTAILFYKRLTRNPKIGNTPVWVLQNIWRLGGIGDTKFSTNISNEMLLNASKCQGYSFYRFWIIKGEPTCAGKITPLPPPRLELKCWLCFRLFLWRTQILIIIIFRYDFTAPLITARSTLCLRGFISRAKELLKRMKQEDSKRTTRGTFYEKEH